MIRVLQTVLLTVGYFIGRHWTDSVFVQTYLVWHKFYFVDDHIGSRHQHSTWMSLCSQWPCLSLISAVCECHCAVSGLACLSSAQYVNVIVQSLALLVSHQRSRWMSLCSQLVALSLISAVRECHCAVSGLACLSSAQYVNVIVQSVALSLISAVRECHCLSLISAVGKCHCAVSGIACLSSAQYVNVIVLSLAWSLISSVRECHCAVSGLACLSSVQYVNVIVQSVSGIVSHQRSTWMSLCSQWPCLSLISAVRECHCAVSQWHCLSSAQYVKLWMSLCSQLVALSLISAVRECHCAVSGIVCHQRSMWMSLCSQLVALSLISAVRECHCAVSGIASLISAVCECHCAVSGIACLSSAQYVNVVVQSVALSLISTVCECHCAVSGIVSHQHAVRSMVHILSKVFSRHCWSVNQSKRIYLAPCVTSESEADCDSDRC